MSRTWRRADTRPSSTATADKRPSRLPLSQGALMTSTPRRPGGSSPCIVMSNPCSCPTRGSGSAGLASRLPSAYDEQWLRCDAWAPRRIGDGTRRSRMPPIVDATDLPVSADLENGSRTPDGVAETVRLAVETGLAGCSVEDHGREDAHIYDPGLAVERVSAAAEAAHGGPVHLVPTARPRTTCAAGPTCPTRSGGSRRTRKPEPTCSSPRPQRPGRYSPGRGLG
jgi:hypothetical protein